MVLNYYYYFYFMTIGRIDFA